MTMTEKAQAIGAEMLLRRARKAHRCHTRKDRRAWDHGELPPRHTGLIARGEQYIEYVGESPLYESGYRYCHACSVAAGLIT